MITSFRRMSHALNPVSRKALLSTGSVASHVNFTLLSLVEAAFPMIAKTMCKEA